MCQKLKLMEQIHLFKKGFVIFLTGATFIETRLSNYKPLAIRNHVPLFWRIFFNQVQTSSSSEPFKTQIKGRAFPLSSCDKNSHTCALLSLVRISDFLGFRSHLIRLLFIFEHHVSPFYVGISRGNFRTGSVFICNEEARFQAVSVFKPVHTT